MKKIIISTERQVTLDGLLTLGKLENGLRAMDFMCCEDVKINAFSGNFTVQVMRDGNIYMTERKKRIRNDSLLIRKAKHGRLSGTRDKAWQLTLKVFACEAIDWQRAFIEESIELMTDLMGPERMQQILSQALKRLNVEVKSEK